MVLKKGGSAIFKIASGVSASPWSDVPVPAGGGLFRADKDRTGARRGAARQRGDLFLPIGCSSYLSRASVSLVDGEAAAPTPAAAEQNRSDLCAPPAYLPSCQVRRNRYSLLHFAGPANERTDSRVKHQFKTLLQMKGSQNLIIDLQRFPIRPEQV